MARSYNYDIFGVECLDDLTEEQYNILVQVEKDRLDAEKKAYDKARAHTKQRGGKVASQGQTVSIKTKR